MDRWLIRMLYRYNTRGQITTMLRQLGEKPVSTDLLLFYDSGRN